MNSIYFILFHNLIFLFDWSFQLMINSFFKKSFRIIVIYFSSKIENIIPSFCKKRHNSQSRLVNLLQKAKKKTKTWRNWNFPSSEQHFRLCRNDSRLKSLFIKFPHSELISSFVLLIIEVFSALFRIIIKLIQTFDKVGDMETIKKYRKLVLKFFKLFST